MEYRILGRLEVYEGATEVPIGAPRHRKLLAILLVHADDVVPADRLIDDLWGEAPPHSAPAILHVRISELRSALNLSGSEDGSGILTRQSGYQLVLGPHELDARTFELLAEEGHQALSQGDRLVASKRLEEALAKWRGPAFAEIAHESFAQAEIARLEALHLQAVEDRLDVDLALGRHAEATVLLQALVVQHPLRERFWGQLMLAQYRTGRQADALQAYQRAREVLVDELGIEPGPELQSLHSAVLNQDPALDLASSPAAPSTARHNLPQRLTRFVGREDECARIADLLGEHRLVTLLGTGGIGKSRVALEVAHRCTGLDGGSWLVELAPLSDPDLIVGAVAAVHGVREHPEHDLLDVLCNHLRTTPSLLLLDNCEHLVEQVAMVAERLLESCPDLTILATSRERLGLPGEALLSLPGLTDSEALDLFTDRARATNSDLRLEGDALQAVREICARLDGMPLAIELAAARVNALTPAEIHERLDDRFPLLGSGQRTSSSRHRTLRAVVDWSYSLLTEAEARVFDATSTFVGGFTLQAAERVCPPVEDADVASLLWRLLDKSLVVSDTVAGRRRYRMLETLRSYGLERLEERGELDTMRARHASYFLAFAEPAGLALRGANQPLWLERLELEHDNLRAALSWASADGDAETAVRLASSLYPMWDLHGHYREGLAWLQRVLALEGEVPSVVRARALLGVATLATIQADLELGATACEEAAGLSAEVGDPAGLAHALQYLGLGATLAGEHEMAEDLLGQSLEAAGQAGDDWLTAFAHVFRGALALNREDHAGAVACALECAPHAVRAGDPECAAWGELIAAAGHLLSGDTELALPGFRAGLIAFQRLGGLWGLSVAVYMCALRASQSSDWEHALPLYAASERLRNAVGATLFPFMAERLQTVRKEAEADLGDQAARWWQAGEDLDVETGIARALSELDRIR